MHTEEGRDDVHRRLQFEITDHQGDNQGKDNDCVESSGFQEITGIDIQADNSGTVKVLNLNKETFKGFSYNGWSRISSYSKNEKG